MDRQSVHVEAAFPVDDEDTGIEVEGTLVPQSEAPQPQAPQPEVSQPEGAAPQLLCARGATVRVEGAAADGQVRTLIGDDARSALQTRVEDTPFEAKGLPPRWTAYRRVTRRKTACYYVNPRGGPQATSLAQAWQMFVTAQEGESAAAVAAAWIPISASEGAARRSAPQSLAHAFAHAFSEGSEEEEEEEEEEGGMQWDSS